MSEPKCGRRCCSGMVLLDDDTARPCSRCNAEAFAKWKAGEYRSEGRRSDEPCRPELVRP